MAGVKRTTFYKHRKKHRISVDNDNKIDVSELVRVYGDRLKTLEQIEQEKGTSQETPKNTSKNDEIARLKADLEKSETERRREREQFQSEIERLSKSLDSSLAAQDRLTQAITDQRSAEEKEKSRKSSDIEQKLDAITKSVSELQENNQKSLWQKLFG